MRFLAVFASFLGLLLTPVLLIFAYMPFVPGEIGDATLPDLNQWVTGGVLFTLAILFSSLALGRLSKSQKIIQTTFWTSGIHLTLWIGLFLVNKENLRFKLAYIAASYFLAIIVVPATYFIPFVIRKIKSKIYKTSAIAT